MTIYSIIWEGSGKPDIPEAQIFQKGLLILESMFTPKLTEFERLQQESSFNIGNLFNSYKEIEGPSFDLVAEARLIGSDKIGAIGPFNPAAVNFKQGKNHSRHECLEWLDKQAPNSVIFVAFG